MLQEEKIMIRKSNLLLLTLLLIVLAACGSESDAQNAENESNENNEVVDDDVSEDIDTENEMGNEGENEVSEGLDEEQGDEAEFPQGEVVYSVLEEEPTLAEEIDEDHLIRIDQEDFIGDKIIYGDGEVVAFKLNRSYRYDVETEKEIWRTNHTSSPDELVSLDDGEVLLTGFDIQKVRLSDAKIIEKIDFTDEEGYEDYIQYNDTYRLGSLMEVIRVTNEETGEAVDLLETEKGEYVPSVLMETLSATEQDNTITTYDNETGDVLAEKEYTGEVVMFGRNGTDDLYVSHEPERYEYGYALELLDGETLDVKSEFSAEMANGEVIVTDTSVFYYHVNDGQLVAIDGELTEERFRIEIGGENLEQEINELYTDGQSVYAFIKESGDIENQSLLQFDGETGEIIQYIQFPYFFLRDFYVLDEKIYIKFENQDGEELYYVLDLDDVHRTMD